MLTNISLKPAYLKEKQTFTTLLPRIKLNKTNIRHLYEKNTPTRISGFKRFLSL